MIVALEGAPETMEAMYGLYEDELDLPETLTAVYSDDTRAELAVTWECISDGLGGTAYDGECENYEQARFTFEARLPEGALCAEDLILPRVQVRLVLPDLGIALYTAADDPTITNTHGVLSYTYTPPEGVTVTGQQWLLNGNPISGASGATYKLTMSDMKNKTNVLSVQLTLSDGNPVTSGGYAMSANTEWEMPYEGILIFTSNYDQSTTDFPLEDNVLESHDSTIDVNEGVTVRGVTQACDHLENQGTITGCTLEINFMLGNFGTIYGNAITGTANVETDNGVFHVPVTINGRDCSSEPGDSLQFLYGENALEALKNWYEANCGAYDFQFVHFLCKDGKNTRVNDGMQLGLSNSFSMPYCTIEAPDGLVPGAKVHASVQPAADDDLIYRWYVGNSDLGSGDTATLPDIEPGATAEVTLHVYVEMMLDGYPDYLELSASATFSGVAYDVAVDYENDNLVITPRDGVTIDGALVQVGNSQFGGVPVDGKCTLPLSYFGDKSFDASLYVYNNDSDQLAGPTSLSLSRATANVDPADFTVTVADTANADGTRDVTVHCANPSKYNAIRVGEKILAAAETVSCKVQPGQDVTVYARTPGSNADKLLPSCWVEFGSIDASDWLYLKVSSQELLSSDALFWGEFLKIKASPNATLTWKINGEDVAAPVLKWDTYVIPAGVSSLSITATDETGSVTWSESDITSPLLVSLDYDNEQLVLRMDSRCRLSLTVRSGSKYNMLGRTNPTYWKLSDFDYPTAQENVLTLTVSHDAGKFDMPVTIPARFAGSASYGSVGYDFLSLDPELQDSWRYTVTTTDSEGVRYADVKFVDSSGAETPCNYDSPTGKWYPVRDNGLRGDRDYSIYAKQYSVDAEGKQNSFASDWFDTGVRFAPCTLGLSTTEPLVGDTVTATIPETVSLEDIEDLHYKWYYVDDSGVREEITGETGDSLTIQPDSGYENRRLRVEAWFVNDRALGYAETTVIPAPEIIVKCDGEELEKAANGNYIAYLGDTITREVANVSQTFLNGADDVTWLWDIGGSTIDSPSLELEKDRFGDITFCDVSVALGKGTTVIELIRGVHIYVAPAPDVTIDYENETMYAVKPDNDVLADYHLRVQSKDGEMSISEGENNVYTIPITDLSSDWPDGRAHELVAFWECTGKTNSESVTFTIPARPAVQQPTIYPSAFAIGVEDVSLADYEMKLVARGGAVTDESVGACTEDASNGNVRFSGLDERTEYTLWMRKKATASAFRSAWTSFTVSTISGIELAPSLNWTTGYDPKGFSLSAENVLEHVRLTEKSSGNTVSIAEGDVTLTRVDGKPFPITEAGTYNLKLTLNGDLADSHCMINDTVSLTVQPYEVSAYDFDGRKTYKGAAYDPYDFALKVEGRVLTKDDYTITVDNGAVLRNVGEYTAHIAFKGNYTGKLDGEVHLTIDPYTLRATARPKNRVYDGTRNVACTVSWDGCAPFAGDDVAVKAVGRMADASVGRGKKVAITLTLKGDQSGNYVLESYSLSGSVDITKAPAIASIFGQSVALISDEALQEYLNNKASIVFDAAYAPVDYVQIPALITGEDQEGVLLICASQEKSGEPAQRSLLLNVATLIELQQVLQAYEIDDLIFENGNAAVRMNLAELTGGNMAKLMVLILSGEEITDEVLQSNWSAMEDATLTEAEYERFSLEVRIVPVAQEDGELGYEISIWLLCDALKLNVSDLMDGLCVQLDASPLVTEENAGTFDELYAIAQKNEEERSLLDSVLALAPTVAEDGDAEESPTPMLAGRYALTALYAGEGMYSIVSVDT